MKTRLREDTTKGREENQKARHYKTTGDKKRQVQDETRQEKTRQDKTRQG